MSQVLTQTIWWLLTQYFGLRGRQEHHSMRVEDFQIGRDENGTKYVQFVENPTKTRQAGLSAKPRSFLPKMFATGDKVCPVALFEEFLSRRPAELKSQGPFYLSCMQNTNSSQVWYKRQPMGIHKINEMMKSIVTGTSLEHSSKCFSNHSARKTVVKKMKTAGLERSSIMKVTGHRNINSLDDYDEADENEQRQLSSTISSGAKNVTFSNQTSHMSNQQNIERQSSVVNTFHNCQVSFYIGGKSQTEL